MHIPDIMLEHSRSYGTYPHTTVWEELRIWGEPDLVLDFGATVMNGTIIGNSHVLMFQWYKTSLTISTLSLCSEVTDL